MRWVGHSFPWLSRKEKAMYERGRSTVCTVYPGAYATPQTVWFTWLYFVILFSCCSASLEFWFVFACCAAMYLHMLSFYISLPLCLTLSPLASAHTRKSTSKSVQGSADEPEQQSFSSPQALVFLNVSHEWKFVNKAMCQFTVRCSTDWINLQNYITECRDFLVCIEITAACWKEGYF